jgi:retron-type reverse transcriptase
MKKQFPTAFAELISMENLLEAWREFLRGKRKRDDVQQYQMRLMDNIVSLHRDLSNRKYMHGSYRAFNICDPKPRNIHKASVRDRLLHHAIYRRLYPFFSKIFIADLYSCQLEKGTHRALNRLRAFFYEVSKNNTRGCWVLKCDIRKFFANVDHEVLLVILKSYIPDQSIIWLLKSVIDSFSVRFHKGLPLGNLTSQLFVNIYMNEFDRFVKHNLKARYYIRYCDDFVILSENRDWLAALILMIRKFLFERLGLELHQDKVFVRTVVSGIDFLGWTHFHDHLVLRTATKRRMLKRIRGNPRRKILDSYLGLLKHGNTEKIQKSAVREYYLCQNNLPPSVAVTR